MAARPGRRLGVVNPSGRLAGTVPVCHEHTPAAGAFPGEFGRVRYGEGLLVGYRWYDTRRLPVAHPFGHGLSYTTFAHDGLTATVREDGDAPRVDVTLTVTNTGDRAGTETVQLYVTDPEASVHRPEQELRAFARVPLAPGESAPVTLTLGHRAFAFWHGAAGRWVVEALGTEGFAAVFFDPHSGPMIRAIPLGRPTRFPGFPLDDDQVAAAG